MSVSPFAAKEMRVAFWAEMKGMNHKKSIKHLVSTMNEGVLLTPTPTTPMMSFDKQALISSMLPSYITSESLKGDRVTLETKDEFLIVSMMKGEEPDPNAMDFFGRKRKYPEGKTDPQYVVDKANFELKSKKTYRLPVATIKARFDDAMEKLNKFKEEQQELEEKMDNGRKENPIYYRGPPKSRRVKYRAAIGETPDTPANPDTSGDGSPSVDSPSVNPPDEIASEAEADGADDSGGGGIPDPSAGGNSGSEGEDIDYGPSMERTTDDPEDENVLIREFDLSALDGSGKYSYTLYPM
jgi:hypothetical protein